MPNTAPTLTGFAPTLSLTENDAPQLLDADVTFIDPDDNFTGGALTLSGLRAEDRAAIRNQGPGAGQIGVSGADVSYGGIVIGTFSGGVGGTLTVTFNAAATSAAIEALIENLTYANVSDAPTAQRTLLLNVTDTDGADLGPSSTTAGFTAMAGTLNPFNGIDFSPPGLAAALAPSFVDLDGDGDLDVVVGDELAGRLTTLENVGDDGDADSFDDFVRLTGTANPFNDISPGPQTVPAFVDLDHDGDLDVVVGQGFGMIAVYENIGDNADAGSFANFVSGANPFSGLDVGFSAAPAFADLDGDGDMDAVIGNDAGILLTFENVGDDGDSDSFDNFVQRIGAANPFAWVSVGARATPAFVDLDGDGDSDLIVGELQGTFYAFENVGDGGDPDSFSEFTLLTGSANPLNGIDVGVRAKAGFIDLDSDGRIEAVLAVGSGLVAYENVPGRGAAIQIEVTAVNDAPTLAGLASALTLPGDATPLIMDGSVTFVDPDVFFGSGTLAVWDLLAEDVVAIRNEGIGAGQIGVSGANVTYGGTLIGTVAGGVGNSFTVTFNDAATSAAVDAVIEHLTYANASGTPTASRTLSLNLADGAGALLAGGVRSITINVISGAAAVAQNDAVSTDEATPFTGSLFADNGSGIDNDSDGPPPGVAAVNGSAANVGIQIQLASGAFLMVNVDGTFVYDPTLAFGVTPAPGSGASNTPAIDSFTYTLAGGATATVTLTITGIDTNDILVGTAGGETLNAGVGNDILSGSGGADTLIGGTGNDIYWVDSLDDVVTENVDEGIDEVRTALSLSLAGMANVENLTGFFVGDGQTLIGNGGDNRITGTSGVNRLEGGGGDDVIDGGLGNDGLFGDDGADTLNGGAGNDNLEGGAGADVLFGDAEDDTLLGGDGDDRLYGGTGADSISGGAGADYIEGGNFGPTGPANYLFGDDGDDTIVADHGNDHLEGGAGRDGLRGGAGANFIDGGADADWLFGQSGNDTLLGGDGDDRIEGGFGVDGISGGDGNDYLDLGASDVTSDLGGWAYGGAGNDTLIASDTTTGQSVYLDGGDDNDGITGSASGDLIDGGGGDDFLFGGGGTDTIRGGAGDDFIDGGDGDDGISDSGGNNRILGGLGVDWIVAEGNNIIDGGGGGDNIRTGAGVDLIDGGAQSDIIDAGAGNDKLYGGGQNDTLIGGDGDDELHGQTGNDFLRGGAGLDIFVFNNSGVSNHDTIADYLAADDSIHLQVGGFNLPLGALNPSVFHFGTQAASSTDRIIYDSATGRVWFDADGTGVGAQALICTIDGDRVGVTASEFTVI